MMLSGGIETELRHEMIKENFDLELQVSVSLMQNTLYFTWLPQGQLRAIQEETPSLALWYTSTTQLRLKVHQKPLGRLDL